MKKLKQIILRAFFAGEITLFFGMYFFGSHGVSSLAQLKNENKQLSEAVACARDENRKLELQIVLWQTNDFYKEKKAREQLQMAHTDDVVYYLDN